MVEDQENPLAPAAHRIAIDHDNAASPPPPTEESKKKRNRKRCLQCCGCTTVVLVILGVTILVLMLTVFKVKDPKVNLNYVTIRGLEGVNPSNLNLVPNTNVTIIAGVSVKNPNVAGFKFRNATTNIYYGDVLIGEARTPQGTAKARKTFQMNVTMEFMLEKISRVPTLVLDLTAGKMPLSTQSNIKGRVEIINIIKKTVGVKLDCTLTVILANQTIVDQKCKRYVAI